MIPSGYRKNDDRRGRYKQGGYDVGNGFILHVEGALLDGFGPRVLGVTVGEVVVEGAPGGGETGAGA